MRKQGRTASAGVSISASQNLGDEHAKKELSLPRDSRGGGVPAPTMESSYFGSKES